MYVDSDESPKTKRIKLQVPLSFRSSMDVFAIKTKALPPEGLDIFKVKLAWSFNAMAGLRVATVRGEHPLFKMEQDGQANPVPESPSSSKQPHKEDEASQKVAADLASVHGLLAQHQDGGGQYEGQAMESAISVLQRLVDAQCSADDDDEEELKDGTDIADDDGFLRDLRRMEAKVNKRLEMIEAEDGRPLVGLEEHSTCHIREGVCSTWPSCTIMLHAVL